MAKDREQIGRVGYTFSAEEIASEFLDNYTILESSGAAAERMGRTLNGIMDAVRKCPGIHRDFLMLKDARYVAKMRDEGIECERGCGLVLFGGTCPVCKRKAQSSKANRRKRDAQMSILSASA